MNKLLLSLAVGTAFVAAAANDPLIAQVNAPAATVAKHGADDPAGDDRSNDGRGHRSELLAKNGADDPAGDDRGNDGRGHRSELLAKNGADDPAGDDRGNDGRGHRSELLA